MHKGYMKKIVRGICIVSIITGAVLGALKDDARA